MKTIPRRAPSFFRHLILVSALALASAANAADVSFYGVVKGENYYQGNPTTPSINDNQTDEGKFFFNVWADLNSFNAVTDASVQIPGSGAVKTLQLSQDGLSQQFRESFDAPLYLDGSYPNGDYVLTLKTKTDGTKTIHLNQNFAYAGIPVINNFNALQAVAAAAGSNATFTVSWTIAGGQASDYVQFQIEEVSNMGGNSELFTSPQPGQVGALTGTSTGVSIPANMLAAGKLYQGRLMVARGFFDSTSYGGGVSGVVAYTRRTAFPIAISGVSAADIYAPQLKQTTPFNGATNVPTNSVIAFTFDERMQTNVSVAASLHWSGGGISDENFSYTWSLDSTTLYCVYNTALPANTTIQWTLNPYAQEQNLKDLKGFELNTDIQGQFTTASSGSAGLKDVRQIFLYKGRGAIQTNAASTTELSLFELGMSADFTGFNTVTNGSVTVPSSGNVIPVPRAQDSEGDYLEIHARYDSQAGLDAFFPNGTYTVTLDTVHDGTKNLSLVLTGNSYPNLPHFSNSVFTAAQSVNSANSFTLGWDAFAGGNANDFIQIQIENNNGDGVFETPGPGEVGALIGTATSTTIPAGKLYPGRTYQVKLMFIKTINTDTNPSNYPGVTFRTLYYSQTEFSLVTIGTPLKAQLAVQSRDANQFTLRLTGEAKRNYTLEASDTLTSGTWFQIGTQKADDTGHCYITDYSIFNRAYRFYRARESSGY